MCGIAGFTFQKNKEKTIEQVKDSLYLRGPDECGHFTNKSITLINTRLKVRDLEQGQQPFQDDQKRFSLVYNGELYNYQEIKEKLLALDVKFKSTSDTEVIFWALIKLGTKALSLFDGMFALALYDNMNDEVLLARDRYGVKPLYYTYNEELSFASQIDTLKRINPNLKINDDGVYNFLSHNYITEELSIYTGVKTLKAGHYAIFKDCNLETYQYWDLPIPDTDQYDILKIERLLKNAVEKQLVADRSVGVFLSSGIDSATIAYFASKKVKNLNTYSIGFENPQFDETKAAKKIADYLGTNHHSYIFTAKDFKDNLEDYVKHCTTPISDLGMYPLYFLTKKAKETSTVLLSGDGGDEIFAGYATIKASLAHNKIKKIPAFLPIKVLSTFSLFLNDISKESLSYRLEKFSKGIPFSNEYAHYFWRTVFDNKEKKELGSKSSLKPEKSYLDYYKIANQKKLSLIDKHLYADFKVWLIQNNFTKVDTATMSHSIEARVPFLDNALIDYMFSINGKTKWSARPTKHILREVMRNKLPEFVINAQKSSFHPPYVGWFRNELYDFLELNLLNSKLIEKLKFNKNYISNLLEEHKTGKKNHSYKLYNLIFLEFWLREHT